MANRSDAISKRERRRRKAEELRAAQRRREQRRTIAYTLGAVAVVAVAIAIVASLSGGGASAGPIQPSSASEVHVSGAERSQMLASGEAIPSFSAPGFRMERRDGAYAIVRERVDWSTYRGSPTVLAIWASWCPHCQRELPILSQAVAGAGNVDLVTILTSIGAHPGPTPNGYLGDHGLTFPVAVDDAQGTLGRAFGLQAFPTLYLVDSDGRVAYAHEGEVPADVLRQELSQLS